MAKIEVHISACWKEYAQSMKEILESEQMFYAEWDTCMGKPPTTPEQLKACQAKLNGQLIEINKRKTEALNALAACNAKSGE
jgi:hypothetical protein